ncbi:MAG: hypothetical protein RLY70_1645 [Planctomycetota bacterium]
MGGNYPMRWNRPENTARSDGGGVNSQRGFNRIPTPCRRPLSRLPGSPTLVLAVVAALTGCMLVGPLAQAQTRRPTGLQPLRPSTGSQTGTAGELSSGMSDSAPSGKSASKSASKFGSTSGGKSVSTSSPNRERASGVGRPSVTYAATSPVNSARIARVSAEEAIESSPAEGLGPANAGDEGAGGEPAEDGGPSEAGEGEAGIGGTADEMAVETAEDAGTEAATESSSGPILLNPRTPPRDYAPEKRIPRVFSAPQGGNRTAMRSSSAGARPMNSVLSNRDEPAAGEPPAGEATEDGMPSGDSQARGGDGRELERRGVDANSDRGYEPGHRFADAPELFTEPWAEPLYDRRGCWWVSGEYLMWWRKGVDLPTMASTGPLDQQGVSTLYGDQTVGDQARPGGRLSLGWAGGPHQRQGFFARVYFMETGTSDYSSNDTENPGLSRPFLDLSGNLPEPNALLVDSLHVRTESDFVGGDIMMRQMIHLSPLARVDFLLGYQFARIDESLRIDSLANNVFELTDHFATANEFHGGALGLQFIYDRPGVRLDMLAKVGLGSMQQEIVLAGSSSSDPQAGLLVQASNRGRYTHSEFMAIPEFGATLTWAVAPSIEFSLGYSLLYFPGVVQAASGIDSQLAVDLNPNGSRPRFVFHDSEYWIHGLNLGLSWRY